MILTIIGAIYFSACAGFLVLYRRALRRTSMSAMTLLPRRDNVIPFRRKEPQPLHPASDIDSVNTLR